MQQVYIPHSKLINKAGSIRCKFSSIHVLYTAKNVCKIYTWTLISNVCTVCDFRRRNIFRVYLTYIYIWGSLLFFSFLPNISSLNVLTSASRIPEKANIFPQTNWTFLKKKTNKHVQVCLIIGCSGSLLHEQ